MAKTNHKQLKGVEDIQFNTDGSIVIKLNSGNNTSSDLVPKEIEFAKERLSQTETAKLFDVTVQTIINWSNRGLIRRYKIANSVFYLKSELLEAARDNSQLQKS